MTIDAVRGRGTEPLLTKFIVFCALQTTSAGLIAVSLLWTPSWPRLAALPVLAGAIGAGVLMFSEARRQRRSLEKLHRGLELLGRQRLPDIVDNVVASRNANHVRLQLPTVSDEKLAHLVGDVEQVCTNAVRLAQEQDEIRSGYAEVFLNMFRRTQTLLLRQLKIIEGLEQENRSASDLNRFYQLDHLVMRMRRNNENILVLSGTELVRKTKDPVPIDDLLRASISEIDSYQRVRLINTPSVRIANTAAGDLIRIVAELLDNATSFSPPDKPVTVKAELARHRGLSIGVIDNGIGMSDADISSANEQLRKLSSVEIARSRRLGLLVAGRLAGRHGFRVELFGGDDVEGVSALVSVPSSVLLNEDAVRAALPGDASRGSTMGATGGITNRAGRGGSAVPVTITVRRQETQASDGATERRPSSWHNRTKVQATRKQATGLSSSDLVAQAHSDVPGELPTRIPNKRIAAAETAKPSVPRRTSRWFQAPSKIRQKGLPSAGSAGDLSANSGGDAADNRRSKVDQTWQMAEKSQHQQDYTYTDDGLPLRKKGAHLFVGSADGGLAADPVQNPKPIERDPKHTQRRLSSYQQGVQKAKEQEARLRGTRHTGGWTVLEVGQK
ncbi:ATP-binding protein [Amycolatopsis mongoliensis]|uniref:histidine kinase n=1 Tax=Amycolatopsis mongoliensis TaxID=715475 RepID=A0A9Y2JJ14_9PSEU|nr:ATP-binding protein [Amycolatopsis sp. 4-36]WIX98193.1 ATP-binding protein [Amycolatopsis sp. 4-36]